MRNKKSVLYEEDLLQRLKNLEYAAGYLSECVAPQEGDAEGLFLLALRHVAKAHGVSFVCKKRDPSFSTVVALLDALNLKFSIQVKTQ